jgi:hypothetical protein
MTDEKKKLEKEVFRKVHHTQESLISVHQQIGNTIRKGKG